MSLARLRAGELLAGGGAVALVVLLFLGWFDAGDVPVEHTSGWATLGWLADALIIVSVLLALWLLVCTASAQVVPVALAAAVLAAVAGTVAVAVIAWRLLVDRPDLVPAGADADVGVLAPAWLGLAAAVVLALGAWRSMADERTDAPESAAIPPPPRPAPPA